VPHTLVLYLSSQNKCHLLILPFCVLLLPVQLSLQFGF
jgi:hypothetical protein